MTQTRWNPIAQSSMHHQHLALGAEMTVQDGWQRPVRYTSAQEELEGVRRGAGILDISPVGKLRLQGEGLDEFLQSVLRDVAPIVPGRLAVHKIAESAETQRVIQARLTDDETLLITAPSQARTVLEVLRQASEASACAHIVNVTSGLAGLRIAGPQAYRVLESLTELDSSPHSFLNMTCAQGMVAQVHGTLLRRDSASLLSYELYFGREFGEYMWDAVLDAGARYGAAPFGLEAASRLG